MIYAEILAGGSGTRMGKTEMPKQFLMLGEKPIIIHTLEKFLLEPSFNAVLIVCPKIWESHTKTIVDKYIPSNLTGKVHICGGGADRNESIMSGISYIDKNFGINDDDIIVTHDAVRPFLTKRIINDNIKAALEAGATDTVIQACDTIVKSSDGVYCTEIPIRDHMYQGQTPQSFNIKKLLGLYNSLTDTEKKELTDAAKIFVIKNEKVKLVKGETFNMKFTSQHDLDVGRVLLQINK